MTGVGIRVELEDAPLRAVFEKLLALGTDLSEPMDEIGAAMITSTVQRFERGEGPDGQTWSDSIRAAITGTKTLVDRGRLSDPGAYGHVFGRDFVEWGTNILYARLQQLGGKIRAKNVPFLVFFIPGLGWRRKREVTIPPRPFLGVDREDEAEIRAILADHIAEASQ